MKNTDIARLRLASQHLTGTKFDTPTETVRFMGAVQAQDYAGGLWAVGLRTTNASEPMIERAIAEREIVRTWPMRRTLHFVAAEDVRWMLELLTPRVIAASAARQHYFGLDESVFARSRKALTRALAGGKQLRRAGVYERLETAGVSTADGRGLHIVARLALEGLICFGAREGKQPTFALLDEWVPASPRLERDEALAELARRYFTSHGPATVQDYVWWSGLTTKDARAGIEMAKAHLAQEKSDGQTYWLSPAMTIAKAPKPSSFLLPPYDEYTIAYKDRSAVLDPSYASRVNTGNGVFSPAVVVEGQLVGLWTRTLKKDTVVITPTPFEEFSAAARRAIARAANRYGEFLGVSAVLA